MSAFVHFADVLLPLPLNRYFTYGIPDGLLSAVKEGCRVVVPLGARKCYTGIVWRIHAEKPAEYDAKAILNVVDDAPVLLPNQCGFWEWMASYYLCAVGEVMNAALPSGLKMESETRVSLSEPAEMDSEISPKEQLILSCMPSGKEIALQDIAKATGMRNVLPSVQSLVDKGLLCVSEGLRETYKVRYKAYVRLTASYAGDPESLVHLLDGSLCTKKQHLLLTHYLQRGDGSKVNLHPVGKKELLEAAGVTAVVLQGLVEKGILETFDLAVDRLLEDSTEISALSVLSAVQQKAREEIEACFVEKPVCLLHGQTSTGKTEVYIHLIEQYLKEGKQVLYLVPEIALTTQLANRLKRVFGSKLGVYHSRFPDAERVELWKKMLGPDRYGVILGARSSVFLPFQDLGLVVVDEEHENSYKQQDPAPRYHARNAALILASRSGAHTLLGTATPSLETYAFTEQGKYGRVELHTRHFDMKMPEVLAVNTRELKRKKRMKTLFSPQLEDAMHRALDAGDQVILFQNRRGYAPVLECVDCSWVPKCERCDVSLTYHKYLGRLTCHYCGYERVLPKACPSCGSVALSVQGFGTEKIEEEVKALFPQAKVSRMDADTTRSRRSYEQIIHDFETGATNVLIGTQMVSKGLDFGRVRVVGVLYADHMLHQPDFRAHERAFQMLVQVSGRAGRQGDRGRVILQTSDPEQAVLQEVLKNDYPAFFQREMNLRKQFQYPPFSRLIRIRFRHRDAGVVRKAAQQYAAWLLPYVGHRMLGPDQPSISRINNSHYQQLLLKMEPALAGEKLRDLLVWAQTLLHNDSAYKSVVVFFDVDPY
jgi:primosomal protein N' (replication factor Y)